MAVRETAYAKGEAGYKAAVSDFSEMFDWDTSDSPTGVPYTDFKKTCGDNAYVALRILKPSSDSYYPTAVTFISKNDRLMQTSEMNLCYVSYASGNGFFVACASDYSMPYEGASRSIFGVSTCRNIVSGETGWQVFKVISGSATVYYNYYMYSKESTSGNSATEWSVKKGAKIGGAVSMHDPATGCVSDKIMMLTAVPDNYTACLSSVVFNGVPYTRVGHLLVPSA